MATIYREFPLSSSAAQAWKRLRAPEDIAKLMPMLADADVSGDVRVCNTVDGAKLRETILSVDDEHRRVAYAITDSPFGMEFHSASMQIVEREGKSAMRWVTDVKPDALAEQLAPVIESQIPGLQESLK